MAAMTQQIIVAALQSGVQVETGDASRGTNSRLDAQVVPDNPAYIGLQTSLGQLDAEESSLKVLNGEPPG